MAASFLSSQADAGQIPGLLNQVSGGPPLPTRTQVPGVAREARLWGGPGSLSPSDRHPVTCALFAGQAGIRWEVVPPHDRALFPYEEQWEVVILKLAL